MSAHHTGNTGDETPAVYLSDEEGAALLQLARDTITAALTTPTGASEPERPASERLEAPGAAFVTLHTRSGALRGCIGSLVGHRPLVDDVRANALAAAFEDPRFPPLTEAELPDVVIEVSVLTSPEPLAYADAAGLVRSLRPGVHGVVIELGWHRATFLPQVWDQLPNTEEFLAHLCYKAGLPANAWHSGDMKVSTYQVQEFEESV